MQTFNIIDLIEKNPISRLSELYNNKFITKINETFTTNEQQLFIASFYCYFNCDQKNNFVIDLDNVWECIGFKEKIKAKILLEKHFVIDNDYKCLVSCVGEQTNNIEKSDNKDLILLNVKTFKLFCIKTGTKKANEIHEYFIKLEDILRNIIDEQSDELQVQLNNKNKQLEQHLEQSVIEKELLVEHTLISQFPINTQCVYYGKIDNKSEGIPNSKIYQEDLIKFGQSNNLGERIKSHKKNYMNFRLVGAFKVKNKTEIENAIKKHPILKKRIRSLTIIDNRNFKEETYRELLALDNDEFTVEKIHNYFEEIIKELEYNIENYELLLKKNYDLEDKIRNLENKKKLSYYNKIRKFINKIF